ncbi:MAG: sugar MFS transporter [Burkholderiales bacterium]|nr:sugar MFS transporter [Burkholderiales bacterium]
MDNNNYRQNLAILLITSLFFMWALTSTINGELIKHFKDSFHLSRFHAGFVDSAYYLAYFIMAIPVGIIISKSTYKCGIYIGLILFIVGSLLFYLANIFAVYAFFLIAVFVIASGATFLETCANTYILKIGDPTTAARRLNFAQSWNGLGAVFASYYGAKMIFAGNSTNGHIYTPYLLICVISIILIGAFLITKLPTIKSDNDAIKINWSVLLRYRHLRNGVIAQFFYVGLQASIWGYFFFYTSKKLPYLSDIQASKYFQFSFVLFMLGRFIGSFLLSYFKPPKLLSVYAVITIILLICTGLGSGQFAIYSLVLVSFFMSIMYPTIFSLSLKHINTDTKIAATYMVMAVIGGAIIPPILGLLSDMHSINFGLIVPIVCAIIILYFSIFGHHCTIKEVD